MLKYGVKLDEKNCTPKKVLVNKKSAEVHNSAHSTNNQILNVGETSPFHKCGLTGR
jgi:hypothetical protein